MSQHRAHLTLLAFVLGVLLLFGVRLSLAIYYATTPTAADPAADSSTPRPPPNETTRQRRDRIAAAPMLATTSADATGGTPALDGLPPLEMPAATSIGPAGIPAGYPRTGEGAAAQLGEILVSALSAMDLGHGQRVEHGWAQPDRGHEPWSVLQLIRAFHEGGQLAGGLAPTASLRVLPVAAQLKGSDGDDWHVACVLLDVTYTYREVARLAYGHCERMTWEDGRWVIAVGDPAVPGPSTWPGTERAVEAGWRPWAEER